MAPELVLLLIFGPPIWIVLGVWTAMFLEDVAGPTPASPAAVFICLCWPVALALVCIQGARDFANNRR